MRFFEMLTQLVRIHAARAQGRGADAEKAYAALVAETQKEKVRKQDQSQLDWAQGLVALAKKNPKAAVESLGKCLPDHRTCRFALVEAQRAAGDKMGAGE